jgi:hypothetical protein
MIVEYAVVLRVEVIPEGASSGPVKEIYFKIFKAGTCGIVGAVVGWPALDCPSIAGGEGLGWTKRMDGAEYRTLNVTLPRADAGRKMGYLTSVARYTASKGQFLAINEPRDQVSLIESARLLRAASLMAHAAPSAQMEQIGLGSVILQPGERAVVPVRWNRPRKEVITECSTHPEAPQGLIVLPGLCEANEFMSLVVENDSELPVTFSEQDFLAVGVGEGSAPSLEAYTKVHAVQEEFCRSLDWDGTSQDVEKTISSPKKDQMIVIVIHKIPRFAACCVAELSSQWKDRKPMTRSTTLTFRSRTDGSRDRGSRRR